MIFTVLLDFFQFQIPFIGVRDFLASFFMLVGYVYRKTNFCIEQRAALVVPICAVIIGIGTKYCSCSMISLIWWKVLPYSIAAVAGALMVFSFCKWLYSKHISIIFLSFFGERTLQILTWHFLSFKIVSLIIIKLYSLPMERLAEFPVMIEYAQSGWWIAYLLVGITIPLLIGMFINAGKRVILRKA